MSDNSILLLPISSLQRLHFTIGNYQRGYKWGKKEVLELLNDIRRHRADAGIYCLQPLIIRPLDFKRTTIRVAGADYELHSHNEIIDGQQRTTTIFLLLSYLKHIERLPDYDLYNLTFTTRARTGEFLANMLPILFDLDASLITDAHDQAEYDSVSAVNSLWSNFVADYPVYDNVDVYHFFIVSIYLKRWCELHLSATADLSAFNNKLLDNVHLVWYSLDSAKESDDIIEVFLNNNKGKIRLTSSELIKALFVLTIKDTEGQTAADTHINRFVVEWDAIEKKLHDDPFWYFLQPSESAYTDGTRIDFLFDLHLEKGGSKDSLFAYRTLERAFNKGNLDFAKEWGAIIQLFNKLVDWYNDSEIYHYLGFLVNTGISSLIAVNLASIGKNKTALKAHLIEQIQIQFRKRKRDESFIYDTAHLNYRKSKDACRHVILLYNVIYHINSMARHKFPFELFVKEKWSLEHIIPQNPKDIDDFDRYIEWFKDQVEFQDTDSENHDIIEALKKLTSFDELKRNRGLKDAVDGLVSTFEDSTHAIGNLLLLDRNTNSALQNESFFKKRSKVLAFDRTGENDEEKPVFIPRETLNAFNKTFSEDAKYTHWTRSDSAAYVRSIKARLIDFLPQS